MLGELLSCWVSSSGFECEGQFRNWQQPPEWENLPCIVSEALERSNF